MINQKTSLWINYIENYIVGEKKEFLVFKQRNIYWREYYISISLENNLFGIELFDIGIFQ